MGQKKRFVGQKKRNPLEVSPQEAQVLAAKEELSGVQKEAYDDSKVRYLSSLQDGRKGKGKTKEKEGLDYHKGKGKSKSNKGSKEKAKDGQDAKYRLLGPRA